VTAQSYRLLWPAALAVIGVVWLASLALPALRIAGAPEMSGFDVLRQGWQGARAGVFSWYANPLWLFALLASLFGYFRTAGVLSGFAIVLALTSFAAQGLAANSGTAVPELSLAFGFYLWLAAQFGLFVWSWGRCI